MSITINGTTNTISASGTVTVPALTLGGAITGNGQNVSGLGTLGCVGITSSGSITGTSLSAGTGALTAGSGTFSDIVTNSAAGVSSFGTLKVNGTTYGYVGVSGLNDGLVTGSTLGDLVVRAENNDIRLSVDAGASSVAVVSPTGLSVTGTLSLNETVPAGITLNVFNASETGTTMGGNTLLRLASNASGADSTIQFTDSVSNNSYISGKSGHIYIQPDTAGISVADFSPTALTLGSGVNLVMASGKGIDFSATSDGSGTTTSEVLSDYEEGTWTPVLTYATPGTLAVTQANYGYYTKIGRQVTVQATVRLSAFTKGTASGALQITGLPFTVLADEQASGVPIATYDAPFTTQPVAIASVGTTNISLLRIVNNSAWVALDDPDANSQYVIQLSYHV